MTFTAALPESGSADAALPGAATDLPEYPAVLFADADDCEVTAADGLPAGAVVDDLPTGTVMDA